MKRLLVSLAISILGFSPALLVAVPAYAACSNDSKGQVLQGIGATGTDADCNDNGATGISGLISNVIKILSDVVGIAAVIMLIIAGLKYATSNGDSNAISSAKSTVIYALIGLVIAALAQLLVQFVIGHAKI